MKHRVGLTILFSLLCLGAGPNEQAPSKQSVSESLAAKPITLQPLQVVYRQVEGTYLKSPRGVWVDQVRNEIYVADTSNDLVAVYDAAGLPVFAFGYNQELKEPTKAIPDSKGHILVLNGIPRVVKVFNYRGEYINDFPLVRKDPKSAPTAIAVDKNGNIYVAIGGDTGGQIQVYDSNFQLLNEFGKKADGTSRLKSVHAIAIDSDRTIFIVDATATPAIQVYSPEGSFLRGWGAHDAGPQNFSLPAGLAIDGDGRVIVVDSLRHTITVFSKEGTFLGRHGGLGSQPGAVAAPTDIATNGNEKIYVVERLGSRLQVLQEQTIAAITRTRIAPLANLEREQIRRGLGDIMKGMK